MKCPDCNGPGRAIETRELVTGETRRRYGCTVCQVRFTTYEVVCQPDGRALVKPVVGKLSGQSRQQLAMATKLIEQTLKDFLE